MIRFARHGGGAHRRCRARMAALVAGLAVLASATPAAAGPAGPAAAETAARTVPQSPREVREYWTPARMRAADPAALRLAAGTPPAAPAPAGGGRPRTVGPARLRDSASDVSGANTSMPDRVHGKVFFTLTGGTTPGDYVCSATAVASPSHTLVWTAGHCVNGSDVGAGFATNWTFIPGYRNGGEPFGSWPATELLTTDGWREHANLRVDLGAAVVSRDAEGRGIEDVVGASGITFNRSRNQSFRAFGYPAQPNPLALRFDFDGERLYACDSPRTANDSPPGDGPQTLEIDCDMTGGSSGGGWVIDGGLVDSVTSYGYEFDGFHLYGPYHGTTAEQLYGEGGGESVSCSKRAVTNLGGGGRDDFRGSTGRDSMRLRGARDTGRGKGGRDRLCGGGGRDLLVGGPGRDVCKGGRGRDRARGCEVRRRIP